MRIDFWSLCPLIECYSLALELLIIELVEFYWHKCVYLDFDLDLSIEFMICICVCLLLFDGQIFWFFMRLTAIYAFTSRICFNNKTAIALLSVRSSVCVCVLLCVCQKVKNRSKFVSNSNVYDLSLCGLSNCILFYELLKLSY